MKSTSLRPLYPVLLTVLIDLIGFGLVIPLMTGYAETFGASPSQVTLLMACYSFAQFLFAPFWGSLSDRVGRRKVMLWSIAGTTLFLALFAVAPSLLWLFVFRTLHGACAANIGAAQAYVADHTGPEDRARGMGLIGAAFGIGFTIGPWLGGELSRISLSAPIWLAAAMSAVNLIWAWWSLPDTKPTSTSSRTLDPRAWISALRHPITGVAIGITFFVTFAFAMTEATFVLVSKYSWDMNRAQVGRLFGLIGVIGILIQGGLIRHLSKRFGEASLIIGGLVSNVFGLSLLGLSTIPNYPTVFLVYAGAALLAIGQSLITPSLSSLISRRTPADEQGAILGSNQSLAAMARATGPYTGGLLFEHTFRGGAFVGGALLLLGALPFAAWKLRQRPPS